MRFEKWQALGNDYVIVEAADLPAPLTAAAVRRALRPPHRHRRRRRPRCSSRRTSRGFVARLRIFNPDGSEAELSGNGAREAIMYLRHRGWTDARPVLDPDGRRRDPPDDPVGDDVPRRHGPRAPALEDFPGGHDGAGELEPAGARGASSTSRSATRSARSRVAVDRRARRARPRARSARRSSTPAVPRTARTSRGSPSSSRAPSARGSSSAGRARRPSSGTGACGAAVAYVLRGGDSPVTVRLDGGELEVDVGEDLHVDLTGWAVPVYAGELDAVRR